MQEYQATKHLYAELIPLKSKPETIINEFVANFSIPLDCSFITSERLFQIFCHKSFTHENRDFEKSNERLEFVGDAVLDLIISEKIFEKYPEKAEGELSKLRSSLVNEQSLTYLAEKLKLSRHILMGRGELKVEGHKKSSLLSDTFEALLGGIFLDHGFEKARSFFDEMLVFLTIKHNFEFISEKALQEFDAKTKLQEIVMEKYKQVPTYKVSDSKEGNETIFEVEFMVGDICISKMSGSSKKKTMQNLAQKILNENLLTQYSEKLC